MAGWKKKLILDTKAQVKSTVATKSFAIPSKYTYIFINTCTMKQKLTLTVESDVVRRAKKMARKRGISVSQMFEEAFQTYDVSPIETETQKAARRLLSLLEGAETVQPLDDKELLKRHLERKYG
jgi:hypothetical protein